MACQLAIQQVLGLGQPGVYLMSLQVSGTAAGCSQVNVTIVCKGHPVTHFNVPVIVGAWQTVFSVQDLKIAECFRCGDSNYPITVQANCADPNETCTDSKVLLEIPCQSACPTISHIEADVPACANAVAADGWNVTFKAYIVGTGVTVCQWDFGDGTNPAAGQLPQGGIATSPPHLYHCAGSYPVSLTILSDCQPNYIFTKIFALQLPTCGCPKISEISGNPSPGNPCTWNFIAKIGNPFLDCIQSYLWNFGDGTQTTTSVPQATHTYGQDGTYAVTLTLQGPIGPVGGGVCYATDHITVSNCGGTGGGGGGNGCPWWNPFCKGFSWCAALRAAALLVLIIAGLLALFAGCALSAAVVTGPVAGIWAALVSSALFIYAVKLLAVGLALLTLWYLVCSRLPGYHFCSELNQLKNIIATIVLAQDTLGFALAAFGDLGCLVGILLTSAVYGTVLSFLQLLGAASGCN